MKIEQITIRIENEAQKKSKFTTYTRKLENIKVGEWKESSYEESEEES